MASATSTLVRVVWRGLIPFAIYFCLVKVFEFALSLYVQILGDELWPVKYIDSMEPVLLSR
jgi:hypothetical protein